MIRAKLHPHPEALFKDLEQPMKFSSMKVIRIKGEKPILKCLGDVQDIQKGLAVLRIQKNCSCCLKEYEPEDCGAVGLWAALGCRCYSVDTFSAKPAWAIGWFRAKKLARCVRFVVLISPRRAPYFFVQVKKSGSGLESMRDILQQRFEAEGVIASLVEKEDLALEEPAPSLISSLIIVFFRSHCWEAPQSHQVVLPKQRRSQQGTDESFPRDEGQKEISEPPPCTGSACEEWLWDLEDLALGCAQYYLDALAPWSFLLREKCSNRGVFTRSAVEFSAMPGTNCQKAIQLWSEKNAGANPEEADVVKLLCLEA
eukprot:s1866_g10.t1